MEGIIRILELDPAGGFPREVIRGDFGSNLILEEKKVFQVLNEAQNNFIGSLTFQQRRNGNLIFTGKISGLSGTDILKLSYFRGSRDGAKKRIEELGQISAYNALNFTLNFPENLIDLAALDTLVGFIGLEPPGQYPADSTNLLAFADFGGNIPTGNYRSYPVFNPEDSTYTGTLKFYEVGNTGTPLRMKFTASPQLANAGNLWLSLHKGNRLEQVNKIISIKIPVSGMALLNELKIGSNGPLKFSQLETWDAHARVAEDTLGENNIKGAADLGANEVMTSDSLISQLFNSDSLKCGLVKFRKRRNGHVISYFKVDYSQAFLDNELLIRTGPKPTSASDTTTSLFKVAKYRGTNGTHTGYDILLRKDASLAYWQDLLDAKSNGHYLEFSHSDEGYFLGVISRGDL
jgi:hypothetical protein